MNKSLQRRLRAKYPDLLRGSILDNPSLMVKRAWIDISVQDEWYDIIDNMLAMLAQCAGAHAPVSFHQIKEKFGTLTIYYSFSPEFVISKEVVLTSDLTESQQRYTPHGQKIVEIIRAAELQSSKVCELCGGPGTLQDTDWIRVMCKFHAL